jgi:hypothetical protein
MSNKYSEYTKAQKIQMIREICNSCESPEEFAEMIKGIAWSIDDQIECSGDDDKSLSRARISLSQAHSTLVSTKE